MHSQFLHELRWQRAMRQMQGQSVTAAQAAQALFRLNHAARLESSNRYAIYALKTQALRAFTGLGFLRDYKLKKQTLLCRACGGTGGYEHWTTVCHKCGGSGVYREHYLYELHFEIEGRHFSWHQPVDHCTGWPGVNPIAEEDATPYLKEQIGASYEMDVSTDSQERHDLAVMVAFVSMTGLLPTPRRELELMLGVGRSLRACAYWDAVRLWHTVLRGVSRLIRLCPDCRRPEYLLGRPVGNHFNCIPF